MLSAPRDADSGLPLPNTCAICGDEFENGDLIVELRYRNVSISGYLRETRPVEDADQPEAHAGCLSEVV